MVAALSAGQELAVGGQLLAPNGKAKLVMQSDGNLVVYRTKGPDPALWGAGTENSGAVRAVMQDDGNFVLYNPVSAVWHTQTDGNPGAWVQIQDDGNLVVYKADSTPLWSASSFLYPMRAHTQWRQGGKLMDADASLTAQGQLRAYIKTRTTRPLKGFTGGCLVIVVDLNDNIIHSWTTWPLGVDGTLVPKRSSREDRPVTQISAEVASQAAYIDVFCSHVPKNRLNDIIAEATHIAGKVGPLIAAAAAAIKG